jgi:hypothetical protein
MKNITPNHIQQLHPNEIFVFGSNSDGNHAGGAAKQAMQFGAIWGQGSGLQGQTYAIPTMFAHESKIEPYVDDFIGFAIRNPDLMFYITRIGCGIAGFTDKQIAPLFEKVKNENISNIFLPQSFWDVLKMNIK